MSSSTSGQDGVTETRFKFLPNTTEKRQSTWNNGFQDIGYQAANKNDSWELGTN